ncbi:hypothetical protein ALMA_1233 [Alloscardovia macacae]|uniref:Uncharacterized protein n=1 Tax=Alloscardovia macacae TaxID=1160091 RepID=A0A261F3I9_9BIFI|nr:hypothetical protein ALMA_1233 [Alloscardovia macacae]
MRKFTIPAAALSACIISSIATIILLVLYYSDSLNNDSAIYLSSASALIGIVFPLILCHLLGAAHNTKVRNIFILVAFTVSLLTAIQLTLGNFFIDGQNSERGYYIIYSGSHLTPVFTAVTIILMLYITLASLLRCSWQTPSDREKNAKTQTFIMLGTVFVLLFTGLLLLLNVYIDDMHIDIANPAPFLCGIITPAYLFFAAHNYAPRIMRTYSTIISSLTCLLGTSTILFSGLILSHRAGSHISEYYVAYRVYPLASLIFTVTCIVAAVLLLKSPLLISTRKERSILQNSTLLLCIGILLAARAKIHFEDTWITSILALLLLGCVLPLTLAWQSSFLIAPRKSIPVFILSGIQVVTSLVILWNSDALTGTTPGKWPSSFDHTGDSLNSSLAFIMAIISCILLLYILLHERKARL